MSSYHNKSWGRKRKDFSQEERKSKERKDKLKIKTIMKLTKNKVNKIFKTNHNKMVNKIINMNLV